MNRTEKERVISDIIVSPHRIDIMSSLSGRTEGLRLAQLVEKEKQIKQNRMEIVDVEIENKLKRNLQKLIQDRLIIKAADTYSLTGDGNEILRIIQDIAWRAKKESII